MRLPSCLSGAALLALSLSSAVVSIFGTAAHAGTLDLMVGAFQITSSTPKSSAQITNFGIYRIGYSEPFLAHFSLGVAYTIVMSSAIGGDLGYGIDIPLNWYPISRSGRVQTRSPESAFSFNEVWRPYLGISFNQRQFQSIQAGYAGGGAHLGCERSLNSTISIKAEARYLKLSGPAGGAITEIDGYAGVGFAF